MGSLHFYALIYQVDGRVIFHINGEIVVRALVDILHLQFSLCLEFYITNRSDACFLFFKVYNFDVFGVLVLISMKLISSWYFTLLKHAYVFLDIVNFAPVSCTRARVCCVCDFQDKVQYKNLLNTGYVHRKAGGGISCSFLWIRYSRRFYEYIKMHKVRGEMGMSYPPEKSKETKEQTRQS